MSNKILSKESFVFVPNGRNFIAADPWILYIRLNEITFLAIADVRAF